MLNLVRHLNIPIMRHGVNRLAQVLLVRLVSTVTPGLPQATSWSLIRTADSRCAPTYVPLWRMIAATARLGCPCSATPLPGGAIRAGAG